MLIPTLGKQRSTKHGMKSETFNGGDSIKVYPNSQEIHYKLFETRSFSRGGWRSHGAVEGFALDERKIYRLEQMRLHEMAKN